MPIKFHEVDIGDRIVIPGRKGDPDTWVVTRKYPNRIFVQSILDPGRIHQMLGNQFDAMGYEPPTIFPDEDEPYVETLEEHYPHPDAPHTEVESTADWKGGIGVDRADEESDKPVDWTFG